MIPYTVIASDRELIAFRKYLGSNAIGTIAIDFESENNLHEYGSRVCLIQIFDGKKCVIIDPFGISKEVLKGFLEDKKVVKLGYGSESDMSLLFKQYQIRMKALYDVKILVDVLNLEKKGLDSVTQEVLGVAADTNKKRYQMHNWTRRPIDKKAIEYALSDVAYLFEVRTKLLERIQNQGLVPALLEEFVKREYDYEKTSIPTLFKSKKFASLHKHEKERAQALYAVREKYAKEQNCPPNDMLLNSDLLESARNPNLLAKLQPARKVDRHRFYTMVAEMRTVSEKS